MFIYVSTWKTYLCHANYTNLGNKNITVFFFFAGGEGSIFWFSAGLDFLLSGLLSNSIWTEVILSKGFSSNRDLNNFCMVYGAIGH